MGWSSWNTFAHNVSAELIKSQADAMVATGLKDAGYLYINTDDGYFGGRDSLDGHLLVHTQKFPDGLRPVVDYIHGQGLKAGIYTDAGANTCGAIWAGNTAGENCGLYGHDVQDLTLFFRDLDFDFLKVDYCGGYKMEATGDIVHARDRYTTISEALDTLASEDVRMNVCTGAFPGAWAAGVAGSWRATSDIYCSWASVSGIISQCLYLSAFASPGHYNDMDMLEVGRGLTPEEDRTHFGLWCIMNSPLLIGCDLRTLSDETLALLSNRELIALNQDSLCRPAYLAAQCDGCFILVKDVEKVSRYYSYSEALGYKEVPSAIQQAMLLHWSQNHSVSDPLPSNVQANILQGFKNFYSTMQAHNGNPAPVKKLYGNTYWSYYYFN